MFNHRPLLCFAAGFIAGIFLGNALKGFWPVLAACLLLILALMARAFKFNKHALFICAMAIGLARICLSLATADALGQTLHAFDELFMPLRNLMIERTEALFGGNARVISAMLWGDRSGLTQFYNEIFRNAGIAHVLALSGLNVSFFIVPLMFIIPKRMAKLRFACFVAFLLLYCGVAAFPSSLVRASLMALTLLAAPLFKRRYDTFSSMSAAALILLILSPMQAFDPGFQLSFMAVVGMALLYKPIERLLIRIPTALAQSIAITTSATLGTLPITAYHFGTFPVLSLVSNLLLLPLVSIVVVCAFVAVMLAFISPILAFVPQFIANMCCDVLLSVTDLIATLPFAVVNIRKFSLPLCICFYLILFFLSDYVLRAQKFKLIASSACAVLAVVLVLVI